MKLKLVLGLLALTLLLAACGNNAMTGDSTMDLSPEQVKIAELQNQIVDLNSQISSLQSQLNSVQPSLDDMNSKMVAAQKELDNQLEINKQQRTALQATTEDYENYKKPFEDCQDSLETANDTIDGLEKTNAILNEWLDTCEKYIDKFTRN